VVSHTPGPWAVASQAYVLRDQIASRTGAHHWITDATGRPLPMDSGLDPAASANARLLAAAPCLLAACGAALVPLSVLVIDEAANGPIREICPPLRELIVAAHDTIVAAIAKAREGTP
jgi:hypothetical protein